MRNSTVRTSLAHEDVVRAYLSRSAKFQKFDVVAKGAALAAATTVADSMRDNFTDLLEKGRLGDRPEADLGSLPRLAEFLRHPSIDTIFNSYFASPRTFVVYVGAGDGTYGVRLHLSGLRWQVVGVDLPHELTQRIALKAAHG
jgi:hypothetical protein